MMSERNVGGRRQGFDRPPREMHTVTCADCGEECQVPFKPDGSRPVYCQECYQKHRPKRF
ncbi:MAG: CxxC-x17-CxxC domain-containing protein [Euryarchaeota archaeon]|nr:CxxC-x17-CxxC domain-containing protein [Euryarchaeota archaeon]